MLSKTIDRDFKEALKAKKAEQVSTLRLLKSAFHNKEIELKKHPLTDDEAIKVISSEVKKRKDSVEAYQKGGRSDLVDQEKNEIAILAKYLPAQLTSEEIEKIVETILEKNPTLNSPSAFGKVMGQAMSQLKGQADGQIVQQVVKNILNSSK